MSLRESLKNPETMIRLGLLALAIGSPLRLFVHPADPSWRDRLDGITGFLTGVTIAAILLGLAKRRARSA